VITFIATAHEEKNEVFLFISSLLLQTDPRWKCIIYSDAPNQYIKDAVNQFNDERITYVENKEPTKFWGHYNRKKALEEMVDSEFVIQTSIQDYYLPFAVKEILDCSEYDFIFFNCLHHHFPTKFLITNPKTYEIDWGSFAVRTKIAKQVGIQQPESFICDGIFVENLFSTKIKAIKTNFFLTVHN
jgi:hypothetical protein